MSRRVGHSALRVGLRTKHGAQRVRNTPISEAAITGVGSRAPPCAVCGRCWRSCSLISPRWRSTASSISAPSIATCRADNSPYRWWCARRRARPAARRPNTLRAWKPGSFTCPGLVVVAPSSPVGGLRLAEKRHPAWATLCLFIEHKRLYALREELPANAELPADRQGTGRARRHRCYFDCLFGHGSQRAGGRRRAGARSRNLG